VPLAVAPLYILIVLLERPGELVIRQRVMGLGFGRTYVFEAGPTALPHIFCICAAPLRAGGRDGHQVSWSYPWSGGLLCFVHAKQVANSCCIGKSKPRPLGVLVCGACETRRK